MTAELIYWESVYNERSRVRYHGTFAGCVLFRIAEGSEPGTYKLRGDLASGPGVAYISLGLARRTAETFLREFLELAARLTVLEDKE